MGVAVLIRREKFDTNNNTDDNNNNNNIGSKDLEHERV